MAKSEKSEKKIPKATMYKPGGREITFNDVHDAKATLAKDGWLDKKPGK